MTCEEFVPQCMNCGALHEYCECDEFEQDDWCGECGYVEEEHES